MKFTPVTIENAHKYYNKGKSNQIHVMDNITLELPESGLVAIFGQSGCGKTTLLNAVGGLDKIASGSIRIFGQDIRENPDTLRNRYIGYIFQNYNLNMGETVYENVAAALRLCGMTDEEIIARRTMAALANVDMAKYRDRTPDTLSGGQQQRVAIARAIVKNPAIILADEPTGNLDETNTVLVMDILKEISKTRLVLLVTHEANLVDFYCDRVIEIVDGRVNAHRQNEGANGYVRRNKNHIYLGELKKTETDAIPGVSLEYYGEPASELKIQVVNLNGKIYLKACDPSVKLLDEGSEIKLMEGEFHEARAVGEGSIHGRKLDMSELTPIEGEKYGRLYHWKNSFKSAWRENFGVKHKKGKKLLRACLCMLAVFMVFTTAGMGAGLGNYADLRRDHNEHLFYVPLDPEADYSALNKAMGSHGMDFARIIGNSPLYDAETLNFSSAAFMTASSVNLTAQGRMADVVRAANLAVVAGEGKLKAGSSDILITTALADKLLESSKASYLNEYADLIGMISRNTYAHMNIPNLRIAGVIESDELFYYVDSLIMAKYLLYNYYWLPAIPASEVGMEDSVKPGQMLIREEYAQIPVGETAELLGKTFTVSDILRHKGIDDYPTYVWQTHGVELIKDPMIYAEEMKMDPEVAWFAWFFEHYSLYLTEYYAASLAARMSYEDITMEEWLVAEGKSVAAAVIVAGYDPYEFCAAYLYHEEYGAYPNRQQLNEFLAVSDVEIAIKEMLSYDAYYNEYDRYMQNHWNSGSKMEYHYVISDEDYIALASSAGQSDPRLNVIGYSVWEDFTGDTWYSNHLMIRSSDPEATAAYLTEALGADGFISPDGVFDDLFREMRSAVITGLISIAVILALMCLCVFFIMRSSFMSRVREVGILRAIGVTKKNLVFRFAVETALLLALTMVPGYVLSAWFIGSLSGAPLFSSLFYFPAWMAVTLFAVIASAAVLFGVLPALLLLRRTPSEILSKYDI